MAYNPDIHHRRSIRLRNYDYSSAGAYFVTICTWNHECLLGDIVDGAIRLNDFGTLVDGCWQTITAYHNQVVLDAFVIMPNHIHGIITIVGAQFIAPNSNIAAELEIHQGAKGAINQGAKGAKGAINRAPTVGEMIRGFKARCTHMINKIRENTGCPVWQRNYYERVLRNDNELTRAREYIINNPLKWNDDDNNPAKM